MEGDHEDGSKDTCKCIFVKVGNRDDIEMPQEARSDIVVDCCHRIEKS
jgi:hypothetical protein